MVEWLEGNGSDNNDEDVWGFQQTPYHLSDLKEWLEGQKKVKQKAMKKKTEEKVTKKKKTTQVKVVKAKK